MSPEQPQVSFAAEGRRFRLIPARIVADKNSTPMGFLLRLSRRTGLRLFRERRRLGVVCFLAFLAGVLLYIHRPGQIYGMPLPLFTGLFYAGFVGTAAGITCLVAPRFRFTIELIAVSRLGFASVSAMAPELTAPIVASPFWNATTVVGGAIVLQWALNSGWLNSLVGKSRGYLLFQAGGTHLSGPNDVEHAFRRVTARMPKSWHSLQKAQRGPVSFTPGPHDLNVTIAMEDQPRHKVLHLWLDDTAGRVRDELRLVA